jgi:hypothetical protein
MGREALIGFFQKANMASASVIKEVTDQFQNKVILRSQFLLTEGIVSDEYFLLEKGFQVRTIKKHRIFSWNYRYVFKQNKEGVFKKIMLQYFLPFGKTFSRLLYFLCFINK